MSFYTSNPAFVRFFLLNFDNLVASTLFGAVERKHRWTMMKRRAWRCVSLAHSTRRQAKTLCFQCCGNSWEFQIHWSFTKWLKFVQKRILSLSIQSCASFTGGELVQTKELFCSQFDREESWRGLRWLRSPPVWCVKMVHKHPQGEDQATRNSMQDMWVQEKVRQRSSSSEKKGCRPKKGCLMCFPRPFDDVSAVLRGVALWVCTVSCFGFARCRALGFQYVCCFGQQMEPRPQQMEPRPEQMESRSHQTGEKNALSVCCGCQLLARAYRTSWFQGLRFFDSVKHCIASPAIITKNDWSWCNLTACLGWPKAGIDNCRSSWLEAFDFPFVFHGIAWRDSQDARGPGWDDIGQT